MVDEEIQGSFEHKSSFRSNTSKELPNENEVFHNRRYVTVPPKLSTSFSDAFPTEEGEEMIHHNLSKALFCFQKA